MKPFDFGFFVDDDWIKVLHVTPKVIGRLESGQSIYGDYGDQTIRLLSGEPTESRRAVLFHEITHYLIERCALPRKLGHEDACDLASWFPFILRDPRNVDLRKYLGLETF